MNKFCKKLSEMKKDEAIAPPDYNELVKLSPSKSAVRTFKGIENQEKQHYKKVSKIYGEECK